MQYSCRNLTRFCKNRFILTSFFQDFNVSYKTFARIVLSSQCFFIALNVSDTFLSLRQQNCCKNLGANSKPSVSCRFRRRQVISDKICFNLHFYSDKLSHYKTHDFRKFLIADAFKHVRLQNTFNRCKVRRILPLMVDYACFLVKCINYQNVMCIQKNYFLQDLARFLQVRKILQESYRNAIAAKNLARLPLQARIMQDLNFL